jgi:hypothetical protein
VSVSIPPGWKEFRLGELADIERRIVDPTSIQSGSIYIGLEHITGEGEFTNFGRVQNGEIESSKFAFNEKHILYGKLRPYLRKIALPSFAGVCSTDIVPIRVKPARAERTYLFHYLRRPQLVSVAEARSVGANLPRISPRVLEGFPILAPSNVAEQRRIAAILDTAESTRRKRRQALAEADALLHGSYLKTVGIQNPEYNSWSLDPEPKKFELEYRTPRVLALRRLLDEIVVGPLRIVRRCLEDMTYIGPLRQVPTRGYRPQVSPDEARWSQGLAAWDLLHTVRDKELIANTSHWLSDPRRLNTGYEIERLEFRRVPIPGPFAAHFQRGLQEDDLVDLQGLYDELAREREVALRELRTGLLVEPSDIGVGLSQLVPVVVAVLAEDKKLLAIEQPELHVHPAIQVGLGDLLISAVRFADQELTRDDRVLLVETHSEHIMLRLLRRVRETSAQEVPPGVLPIFTDDIAVHWFEPSERGIKVTRLHITDDGDFADEWPHGFFEERQPELF